MKRGLRKVLTSVKKIELRNQAFLMYLFALCGLDIEHLIGDLRLAGGIVEDGDLARLTVLEECGVLVFTHLATLLEEHKIIY